MDVALSEQPAIYRLKQEIEARSQQISLNDSERSTPYPLIFSVQTSERQSGFRVPPSPIQYQPIQEEATVRTNSQDNSVERKVQGPEQAPAPEERSADFQDYSNGSPICHGHSCHKLGSTEVVQDKKEEGDAGQKVSAELFGTIQTMQEQLLAQMESMQSLFTGKLRRMKARNR